MARKNSKLPSGIIKRGRVYYSNFRFEGKLIRGRLSPDLSVAKEMLIELRHRLYRNSIGDVSNDYQIKELSREWLVSAASVPIRASPDLFLLRRSHAKPP